MVLTLILVSLVILLSYLAYTIALFWDKENPVSVSDTYYLLEKRKKKRNERGKKAIGGWLFLVFCWTCSLTLLIPWIELTPESLKFTCFLSASGLLFVGTAAPFKESLTKEVHYTSAGFCAIFSQIWVITQGYWWIALISFLPFIILAIQYKKKKMFWIEIASFVSTYTSIILKFVFDNAQNIQ